MRREEELLADAKCSSWCAFVLLGVLADCFAWGIRIRTMQSAGAELDVLKIRMPSRL